MLFNKRVGWEGAERNISLVIWEDQCGSQMDRRYAGRSSCVQEEEEYLGTAQHKADPSLCELSLHCQQGTIRVGLYLGDMVVFLLDPIVIVQTRSKQDLSVGDGIKLWKCHVISLHLCLPTHLYIVLCLM